MKIIKKHTESLQRVLTVTTLRFFQGGAGVFTAILVSNLFSNEDLGLYYILLVISGFWTLIDFGLNQAIIPHYSRTFPLIGQTIHPPKRHAEFRLSFCSLMLAYGLITVSFFLLMLSFSFFYFHNLGEEIPLIWLVFYAFFVALQIFANAGFLVMEAIGKFLAFAQLRILTLVIATFVFWSGLIAGLGVYSLILLPGIIAPLQIIILYRSEVHNCKNFSLQSIKDVLRKLGPISLKAGAGLWSAYFLMQAPILWLPLYIEVDELGPYGLNLAIANVLVALSSAYTISRQDILGKLAAEKEYSELRSEFRASVAIYFLVFAILASALYAILSTGVIFPQDKLLEAKNWVFLFFSTFSLGLIGILSIHARALGTEAFFFVLPAACFFLYLTVFWQSPTLNLNSFLSYKFFSFCVFLPLAIIIYIRSYRLHNSHFKL
tara:strand:+ start:4603 stop:5904 length:1302 start_codon:yes stop_codon:yes gene_type:complete